MRNYIKKVDLKEFADKYDKSTLSFKYTLQGTMEATVGDSPIICLDFTPSGYEDPKCFRNGEFDQTLIDPSSHFIVSVSNLDVHSDKLTDKQKRQLLELMHSYKPYSQNFYNDYREYHIKKVKKEYEKRIKVAELLKTPLTRTKGAAYYNEYIKSINEEYRNKIREISLSFTPSERI